MVSCGRRIWCGQFWRDGKFRLEVIRGLAGRAGEWCEGSGDQGEQSGSGVGWVGGKDLEIWRSRNAETSC